MDVRNGGISGWITHGHHQHGLFMSRPAQEFPQKAHGRGRVGEGDQPQVVNGLNEHPRGDATGFNAVIGRPPVPVAPLTFLLPEQHNDPRRIGEVGFDRIRAQWRKHFRPSLRHTLRVGFSLFSFGCCPEFCLQLTASDGHPCPRLKMSAIGCSGAGENGELDQPRRNSLL